MPQLMEWPGAATKILNFTTPPYPRMVSLDIKELILGQNRGEADKKNMWALSMNTTNSGNLGVF